jgi:hypothetical protein
MVYVIWREGNLWNISVLERVHLFNLVVVIVIIIIIITITQSVGKPYILLKGPNEEDVTQEPGTSVLSTIN